MITIHILRKRLQRTQVCDPEQHLTSVGQAIRRFVIRHWPFVTKRRFLLMKADRDWLLHELHMLAIENNRLTKE
jgi:hypothetical protein